MATPLTTGFQRSVHRVRPVPVGSRAASHKVQALQRGLRRPGRNLASTRRRPAAPLAWPAERGSYEHPEAASTANELLQVGLTWASATPGNRSSVLSAICKDWLRGSRFVCGQRKRPPSDRSRRPPVIHISIVPQIHSRIAADQHVYSIIHRFMHRTLALASPGLDWSMLSCWPWVPCGAVRFQCPAGMSN
jgi:hypothetical protein